MRRLRRSEAGQMAGIEAVPFGVLVLVVGALIVANAWAVIDAKMAVSAAAREATRAYVEAPPDGDPLALAEEAAKKAVSGNGRDPERLELALGEGDFARCRRVRFQASYQVPAVRVPWMGAMGEGFTVRARHAEVVDPFRSGVPKGDEHCDARP